MTTRLSGTLKRELRIDGADYTLTITPASLVLAAKGRRKGLSLSWDELVSGEAALANALNASLSAKLEPAAKRPPRFRVVGKATTKRPGRRTR
jgi:hypothetical protein